MEQEHQKKKRCPNGTRRNKKTGECEHNKKSASPSSIPKKKRCLNGTRRNKKTGECVNNKKPLLQRNNLKVLNHSRQIIHRTIKSSTMGLNIICPNSGSCMAFGTHCSMLSRYFKHFIEFDYVNSVKSIGTPSANGFINQIEYEKNNYKSYAILKSSQHEEADNLMYEYIVGMKFVNRQMKVFPCFVETYGLYYYPNNILWNFFNRTANKSKTDLKKLELQHEYNYRKACEKSKYISILIQHIDNPQNIRQMVLETSFLNKDLLYILFVIYHALSMLSKTFTHYDLHGENVMLYTLNPDQYIEYHYHHIDGTTTSFFSSHIPKIIDYGRSFFDNGNVNSKKIYDKICSVRECDNNGETCGDAFGFNWTGLQIYQINSLKKNESHDLRLLNDLKFVGRRIQHIRSHTSNELYNIINSVIYGVGIADPQHAIYGTVEDIKKNNPSGSICNVKDAYTEILKAVKKPDVIRENGMAYASNKKIGDFYIYDDGRPMKFEKI